MKNERADRTGTASWIAANFGKLCGLVVLNVSNHGHNFKGPNTQGMGAHLAEVQI